MLFYVADGSHTSM